MTTTLKIASQLIHETVSTPQISVHKILLWFNFLLIYGTWLKTVGAHNKQVQPQQRTCEENYALICYQSHCEWDLMFISFFTKFNITIADSRGRKENWNFPVGETAIEYDIFSVVKAKEWKKC